MKLKMKNKILMTIITGVALSTIIIPNKANAALQSNGGTPTKRTLGTWMLQIRQMQELGGTLGRTDTINTTNLASNATDLDIHMEKNTEYGAMAILSASAYGNPSKINDGETTTGNSTGIVINLNREWVAAIQNTWGDDALKRYKNLFVDSTYTERIGDAMFETKGWHGGSKSYGPYNVSGILRSYSGSIFSYQSGYDPSDTSYSWGPSAQNVPWASRACIVVGTGL